MIKSQCLKLTFSLLAVVLMYPSIAAANLYSEVCPDINRYENQLVLDKRSNQIRGINILSFAGVGSEEGYLIVPSAGCSIRVDMGGLQIAAISADVMRPFPIHEEKFQVMTAYKTLNAMLEKEAVLKCAHLDDVQKPNFIQGVTEKTECIYTHYVQRLRGAKFVQIHVKGSRGIFVQVMTFEGKIFGAHVFNGEAFQEQVAF